MTVSYQYEVASSTSGGFTRLLFMWRGSLYKLIYRELLLFLGLFAAISVLYRYVLTKPHKRKFEQIVVWCDTFISLMPLTFVLGFYVAYVAGRWWQQYIAIPWPDKVMHLVALYVTGNDEYGRMLRRALMRYLNLSLILVLRSISSAVKRRFPTLDHVVDSGFMTSLELELFQSVPSLEFNTYWIPCTWFINLLKEARRSHRLPDAQGLKIIMEEFNDFRSKCGLLWSYDWVSIPLVYTQVVTLATYSFFVVALVGRQYIEGTKKPFQMEVDAYLPIFTILQFFFYMGLLKVWTTPALLSYILVPYGFSEYWVVLVARDEIRFKAISEVAEQLINPFGDDDEDFELNWLIDRHTKVSYLGVDTLMNRCPPLVKDIYYDAENLTLPYTEAAAAYKRKTYRGSVANMTVPEEKQTMFLPDITEEDEESKNSATPRTSTASLTHSHESPTNGRRQISGSPSTTPKMGRNGSETIVQLDLQEINEEIEQADRRAITEVMKKTSARSSKCSTPRLDQHRKPFFAGAKPAKVNLQPWPSATNLSRLAANQQQQQQQQAPVENTTSSAKPGNDGDTFSSQIRSSLTRAQRPPCINVSSHDPSLDSADDDDDEDEDEESFNEGGFINSAFSQENIVELDDNRPSGCHCSDQIIHNCDDHSDVCQFQCLHQEICQHPDHRDTHPDHCTSPRHLDVVQVPRRRLNSCPKFLVRRQSSTGSRKKAVRWKRSRDNQESGVRRKTVDCVPSVKKLMPQTSSSPNLKSWTIPTAATTNDDKEPEPREDTDEDKDESTSKDKLPD